MNSLYDNYGSWCVKIINNNFPNVDYPQNISLNYILIIIKSYLDQRDSNKKYELVNQVILKNPNPFIQNKELINGSQPPPSQLEPTTINAIVLSYTCLILHIQ